MIDIQNITELLVQMSWVTPLVIGLVAVIRVTTRMEQRWVPLTSLILGTLMGLLVVGFSSVGALVGIVMGLSSSGLYDVTKKSVFNG